MATTETADIESHKAQAAYLEHAPFPREAEVETKPRHVINDGHKHDVAADLLNGQRIPMTHDESERVRRKIDKHVLPILMWVYFLQILDKNCVGYAANFGLITETNLVGQEYSLVSSSGYWAQLALCMGPTMFMIVRVPTNILMSVCTFCWGVSMLGLAFSRSFGPLLANRFLLGLFEAVNIPLFTVITTTWYRRREQPLRIAAWYGTNGISQIIGSPIAFGLSYVNGPPNGPLYVYQALFLLVGLLTVVTAPFIYFFLDNNPAVARFLDDDERKWAVERLRSNNTGTETKEVKWNQVWELALSPAIWVYFFITFCTNTGAAVTGTFGPLIIQGFGFNARQTILLNMPFGFLQLIVCVVGCMAAAKWRRKSTIMFALLIPCVIGSGLLYGLGRGPQYSGPLLFGYYLLAFLFGTNPIVFSWVASNTGGHTKKALAVSLCNAGSAVGNIVGPLMFRPADKPAYKPGLSGVLGVFCGALGLTVVLIFILIWMNKSHEKRRVALGKPAKMVNSSMDAKYKADDQVGQDGRMMGEQAFSDLTDKQNDEFVYSY